MIILLGLLAYWAIGVKIVSRLWIKEYGQLTLGDLVLLCSVFWMAWPLILFIEFIVAKGNVVIYRSKK